MQITRSFKTIADRQKRIVHCRQIRPINTCNRHICKVLNRRHRCRKPVLFRCKICDLIRSNADTVHQSFCHRNLRYSRSHASIGHRIRCIISNRRNQDRGTCLINHDITARIQLFSVAKGCIWDETACRKCCSPCQTIRTAPNWIINITFSAQ